MIEKSKIRNMDSWNLRIQTKSPNSEEIRNSTISYWEEKNDITFVGNIQHRSELILTQEFINDLQEMYNRQQNNKRSNNK
jgi:hypothetical protein